MNDIITKAKKNPVKCGDVQSGGVMKEILDAKQPISLTRYGHIEAYLIPAHLIKEFMK